MRNFNQNNRSDDRGNRRFGDRNSGRRNYSSGDSGRPTMYQAICAECGSNCEVPFKPSGDRPIFCSKCFEAKDRKGGKRFGGKNAGGHGFADRDSRQSAMYSAVCAECGQSCEVPFQPRDGRSVFCSSCFENRKSGDRNFRSTERLNNGRANFEAKSNDNEQVMMQFDILNAKLDKILKLFKPATLNETVSKEEDIKKVKVEKPKKEVKKAVAKEKV